MPGEHADQPGDGHRGTRGVAAGRGKSGPDSLRTGIIAGNRCPQDAATVCWRARDAPARVPARREHAPPAVRELAANVERRLVKKYRRLSAAKHTNLAKAAVARELIGHLWEALRTIA